jgi:hypothetical protein
MLLNLLFQGKTITGALALLIIDLLQKYKGITIPYAQAIALAVTFVGLLHKGIKAISWPQAIKDFLTKMGIL